MFAGIVKAVGEILDQQDRGGDRSLTIGYPGAALGDLAIGASVAVNGVCLTVTAVDAGRFAADVSAATLAVTTFGRLAPGARVNLEPSLKIGDSLDGHFVTGHVDGVAEIVAVAPVGRSTALTVELPSGLARYVARKGSIALDGVSLTVNAVADRRFDVNIIPHTAAVTVIGAYAVGSAVNIEVDVIARYLERLSETEPAAAETGITLEFLQQHGYASKD
jgi:riboflavin synthase